VRAAWELRRRVIDRSHTSAFRLVHGEGDRLPGVVADYYAGFLVMKLDTPAWLSHLAGLAGALDQVVKPKGIYFKGLVKRSSESSTAPSQTAEHPRVLSGETPPEDLEVTEHGLRFKVNVFRGQKTGLFLDQRENRLLIRGISENLTVLNLHAYTGGFSLAAAAGGARRLTSVDLSPAVIDAARENFALNGFDPRPHEFVAQDAIAFLKACAQSRRQFDLVIVDPPSLAMRKQAVFKASRTYVRLNERAMRQVKPGGFLATASCSTHISTPQFLQILREAAAAANRPLRLLAVRHEPPDHPVPLHFPEGHYLKFVLALVEPP
jgi:23S rRNA (cytosine1962-C5)-methyltransferase